MDGSLDGYLVDKFDNNGVVIETNEYDVNGNLIDSTKPDVPVTENIIALSTNTKEVDFSNANGGIIITKKDGCFGVIDYTGKEIVPNIYDKYYRTVNEEGQFVLGDAETQTAYVFDAKGNELLKINDADVVQVNENIVTYVQKNPLSDEYLRDAKYYNILTGESGFYIEDDAVLSMSAMTDGWVHYAWGGAYTAVHMDGTITFSDLNRVYFPYGIYKGYGTTYTYKQYTMQNFIGVASDDLKEVIILPIDDFMEYVGIENVNDWWYEDFYENGIWHRNISKKTVLVIDDNGTNRSFLLDFSKAKIEKYDWLEYEEGDEVEIVLNSSDVIIAEYSSISLSSSGVYLASDGENWFYIDDTGEVIVIYDDCAAFNSDGYAAESVHLAGNAFVAVDGTQETILIVQ